MSKCTIWCQDKSLKTYCTNWCQDKSLKTYCDDQCEVAYLKEKLKEAREVLCEYIERRERCNSEVCMNSLYDLREQLKEKGE